MTTRIAALMLLCAAPLAARAENCRASLEKLAGQEPAKWERFLFGLQSNHSRGLLTHKDAAKDKNLAEAVGKMGKSCRSNAYALDYLFRGVETREADLPHVFSKADLLHRVDQAIAAHKNVLFHFRIPKELMLGPKAEDTLGHHFVLDLDATGPHPAATVYMAFEDKFSLTEWLKKTGAVAHNAEAGGAALDRAHVERWAADLENLMKDLQDTKKPAGDAAAYMAASQLFARLFSVSFPQMGFPAKDGKVHSAADTVRVYFGEFDAPAGKCAQIADEVLKEKAFSCTGVVCG